MSETTSGLAPTAIEIRTPSRSYDVLIGRDLLRSAGATIAKRLSANACAVISDVNVASRYSATLIESLGREATAATLVAVPADEKSKSLDQVQTVCEQMARSGLDRSSFVVALGGGVIGDLAGFVASIYHRGIPYVQVPTTLLAQVDSAIGGKTGVNIPAGKNLVGSLHHPTVVIADVDTLGTLPERVRNEGFAEVVKHAIIRDAALFKSLFQGSRALFEGGANGTSALQDLIRRNVEIKAEIVASDERETNGARALLNFGHTIGHAIEKAAGYGAILHGEAVSLGIVAASAVSMRRAGLGETEYAAIVAMLEAFRLPTRLPAEFPRDRIREALRFDKKFQQGQIRFVVTPAVGSAFVSCDVTADDLEQAIAGL